jgi:PPOX class probable F420-dependent enzyme
MSKRELVRELLEGPYPCCLTTLRADGDPYGVVVWCAPEGDLLTVNAAQGRWLANLRRDPRVSLVVIDTAEILRYVGIDGRVVAIEPDLHYAHIDALSDLYQGRPYAYTTPERVPRFKVTIEALRTRAVDES